MKLTMFPSDKGDCLLLESNGRRMLCDGGMQSSFDESVAPELSKRGGEIDIAYISHIDDDHIAGILKMLRDTMDWKVFDFHKKNGDTGVRKPKVPRPPKLNRLWHNAFHDIIGKNAGPITDLLAAMAPMLSSTENPRLQEIAQEQQNLILSKAQAIQVSQMLSPKLLGIPVNEAAKAGDDHTFMMVRDGQAPSRLGNLKLTIIGPFESDLRNFRDEWNEWLRANKETVTKLRRNAKTQADRLSSDIDSLFAPFVFSSKEFGDRKSVTLPNLVSLMLHVEGDGKTLLLTGDGHSADILKGLEQTAKIPKGGDIHVDILKVQHHGSEHNIDEEFCRRVSADHYVFCGNGFSGNPELGVVELLYNSRFGKKPGALATNAAGQGRKAKFWFNTVPERQSDSKKKEHMKKLRLMCQKWSTSQPKFSARFMKEDFLEVR